jgi:hypothetical protein
MVANGLRDRGERQLVRKLDWIGEYTSTCSFGMQRIALINGVLPILTFTFGLQYYDKAVLGSAAVFGIIEDLGLSQVINGAVATTRYSTVTAAVS